VSCRGIPGAVAPCSWTPEESEVESSEHQDYANINRQPLPEPVSEEREVYTDYDGCHRHSVNQNSCLSAHFSHDHICTHDVVQISRLENSVRIFPRATFNKCAANLRGSASERWSALSPGHQFEELFFEHYPRLVKTLLRLVGNSGQAEELAADAFYKLHQHRSQQQADENPAGWLYRTAMNLGLDALRSKSRRVRREEQAHRDTLAHETPGNPLYEMLAEEQRERVRTVIARLKPIHGQVLLMGSSGFTSKEIAAVLGVRLDSLYVLISRAKTQFEKEYTGLYGRAE